MKSRKIKLIIFLGVLALCNPVSGIAIGSDILPVLTNYRIPLDKKGAVVGKLIIPSEFEGEQLVLQKDTSGLFQLDRHGNLRLKKSIQMKSSEQSFCYGVTIGVGSLSVDFNLVKDEFIQSPVIAHRGAWKNHPGSENSLSALKSAIRIGACGSEFDVWWSEDKVPVVSHDPVIGGKNVEKTSAKELQTVKLEENESVPTLEQYLQTAMQQNRTHLVLEIKSSQVSQQRTIELTEAVVRMVHKMRAQAWVEYISFNYETLLKIRQLDPVARIAYLSDDKSLQTLVDDRISGIDYSFYSYQKDPELIEKAHKLGLTVNVWTVNDKSELEFYVQKGVDFITTNEPEALIKIINDNKQKSDD